VPFRRVFKPIPLIVGSIIILASFAATLALVDHWSAHPDPLSSITPRSTPVTEATTLQQLPRFVRSQTYAEDWDGEYLVQWEGIEGLNASSSHDIPMVKYHPAVELVPVPADGLHRLGIQARGLTPKVIFQVGVWIKGGPDTKIALNTFDGFNVTSGTSSFDLSKGTVISSVGAVRKAGVKAGSDYWHKAWVRMLSTNGWLVTYIQVLNADGAAAYKGDGKKVVVFGGIEIMPTVEELLTR
jgi:hypothetical protein